LEDAVALNAHDSIPAVPLEIDTDHARMRVGRPEAGKAHILHCNYYNNYLLRTAWQDIGALVETRSIILGAAAEQSYTELHHLFQLLDLTDIQRRKAFAHSFFAWQGMGALDLSALSDEGGTVTSEKEHYAEGWKIQFGRSDEPVGLITQGWLSGAAAAIFDTSPSAFSVTQTECAAVTGGTRNAYRVSRETADFTIYTASGVGPLTGVQRRYPDAPSNVDADAIRKAVLSLPLFGDPDRDFGLIHSFDVLISWHPHQLYDRISFECLHEAMRVMGDEGRRAVEPLLEEAGHRCAFRTFGGIWRSMEWEGAIEPMCQTREDWIHGMVAVINCTGWGYTQCTHLTPDEAEFVVHDDYESVGYRHLYKEPDFAPTYLLRGGFRGLMNLVYNGDMPAKPALTEAFYEDLSKRSDAFEVEVTACRAMGDPASVYRVRRRQ
jgi:hypothetical protein